MAEAQELRELVAPFYGAFATGDLASLDKVFAPTWKDNTLPPGRSPGLAGLKQAVAFLRTVLPDVIATVETTMTDGDRVAVRATFSGPNSGGFPGIGPNGQKVSFIAFDMHRIAGGKIIESWHLEDNLSFLIQVGVVPALA